QAPGERVGMEAQLIGRREHPLACLGAQLPPAVERLRGRADGDLGQGGHIRDGGRASLRTHEFSFTELRIAAPSVAETLSDRADHAFPSSSTARTATPA